MNNMGSIYRKLECFFFSSLIGHVVFFTDYHKLTSMEHFSWVAAQ